MVYQLLYELKTPDMDYSPLFSYLEHDMGTSAKHVLRDCWWIAVDDAINVDEACDKIRGFMGDKDNIYLCQLPNSDINGWMPSSIWKWFSENKD